MHLDHEIQSRQRRRDAAKSVSDDALEPVALHRLGHHPSRDDHPDATAACGVRRRREGEPDAPLAAAGTQGKLELLWSAQPGG